MARVLFLGGTGQISRPCVTEAVRAGHEVVVFTRGQRGELVPDGVEAVIGDMRVDADMRALGRRSFDVVCQFQAFTTEQVTRDLDALAGRMGQYVFLSSASVYQKPPRHHVITEETPAANPYSLYAQQKIACEALLHERTDLNWTIVRPSHTPRTNLPTMMNEGDVVGRRMLAGKPVIVSGDGTTPWTITRAADFAVPFVRLFGNSGARGETFHITSDHAFTWNEIYTALGAALGVTPEIVHVPTDVIVRYHKPWERHLRGDKSYTALFDNSKVKRVAGDFACAATLEEIIREPVSHFNRRMSEGEGAPSELDALTDRIVADISALGL